MSGVREESHKVYLSTSGGCWRVIVQGQPICADKATRAEAEAAARAFKVTPSAIWNGDNGEWCRL